MTPDNYCLRKWFVVPEWSVGRQHAYIIYEINSLLEASRKTLRPYIPVFAESIMGLQSCRNYMGILLDQRIMDWKLDCGVVERLHLIYAAESKSLIGEYGHSYKTFILKPALDISIQEYDLSSFCVVLTKADFRDIKRNNIDESKLILKSCLARTVIVKSDV